MRMSRLFLLLVLFTSSATLGVAQPQSLNDKILEAFAALENVSQNGGDVSTLVQILNEIILEVGTGDFDQAVVESKLDTIIYNAQRANVLAIQESRVRLIIVGTIGVLIVLIEYIVWKSFPRFFWKIWIRKRGHWEIK